LSSPPGHVFGHLAEKEGGASDWHFQAGSWEQEKVFL
jgi:hypothetical protein